jgi:HEAT repeat protein
VFASTGTILCPIVRLLPRRPPDVEKLAQTGSVKGLVRALRYEDPVTDRDGRFVDLGAGIRAAAARGLARQADADAYDALVRALADPEDSVRLAAVHSLRERGDRRAVEPLLSLAMSYTDEDQPPSRGEAIRTLALLRDAEVARRAAAELLARPEDLNELDVTALRHLARAGGSEAIGATIEDLLGHMRDGPTPGRARRLVVALAPESVEPLISSLDDNRARQEAVLALGAIRDSRAVGPLGSLLLEDGDSSVRSSAAWALGAIRDPAATEPLLAATRDPDYDVRAEAVAAFDGLGNAGIALAVRALAGSALEDGAHLPAPEIPATGPNGPALPKPPPSPRATPLLRRLLGR